MQGTRYVDTIGFWKDQYTRLYTQNQEFKSKILELQVRQPILDQGVSICNYRYQDKHDHRFSCHSEHDVLPADTRHHHNGQGTDEWREDYVRRDDDPLLDIGSYSGYLFLVGERKSNGLQYHALDGNDCN